MWFPPPHCIQIGSPDSAEKEIIWRKGGYRVPALLPEAAQVALEGGQQMIPVPPLLVATDSFRWTPVKSIAVGDNIVIEALIRGRGVAAAMPDATTRLPM